MLDSSSSGHLVNPVLVTINGYGNDSSAFLGTNATISTLAGGTQGAPPGAQVYQITSTNTAGNLTIVTTDQQNDQLIYNAGNGSNAMTLQNSVVNPGAIVLNSATSSPGTDTVNIWQAVGSVTVNQNGKNQIVNIGSPGTGALPAIKSPVMLAGAVAYILSPTGYLGSLALNVNDAGDAIARTGQVTSGVISGLGLGGNTISYTYASSVNVILGDGGNNATVAINQPVPTTVQAGAGNDTITASTSTDPVTIIGGAGHDILTGSNFGDLFAAGGGTDSINEGLVGAGNGINTITAGDGNDTVTTGIGQDSINLGNGTDFANLGSGNVTLLTGNGNDSVTAGTGSDSITVGNGIDTISAIGGNDTIAAGFGNDSISVGDGNDNISVLYGTDTIRAGNGADLITEIDGAGIGTDFVTVGNGPDTIALGNGNDSVIAGDGGDRITTGSGNSRITSGAGNDVILVGSGNNTIGSGAGDDILDIGAGSNTVDGGSGTNVLVQQSNVDQTLTDTSLTAGTATTSFSGIQRVSLIGGSANHNFDVSGWTNGGSVQLTGGNGTSTVSSHNDTNFTLSDSSLARSDGTVFSLVNIQNAVLTGGTSSNSFDVSGWTRTATLNGGGGLGVDTIVATNNVNLSLVDVALTRSGFGLLTLFNIARAILTANLGNLQVDATGFSGQATLLAGPGNDTLRGGTGGDYLAGGTGHDSLVSNGGKDVIVATPGSGDTINAGTGGDIVYSTNGADIITGAPASLNPAIPPGGSVYSAAGANLPTGGDESGPWAEYSGSASAGGVSNSTRAAIDPTVTAGAGGQFVAWADNRSGTYEIYVARHTGGSWQEMAGSDHGGGISNTVGDSRRPAITLDSSGNAIVAWTTFSGTSSDIESARFDPTANSGLGGWVALGSSLSAGGISATGAADNANIVQTTNGPVVTWLDSHTGITNVYAVRYSGGVWSPLGAGAASGHGVSNSATSVVADSLASDGTNVAVAWTQPNGVITSIYLLEYTGSAWTAINGSTSGTGVSSASSAAQPTVAFANSAIDVAWQNTVGQASGIAAATSAGGVGWQAVSIDSPGSAVHSGNGGNFGASSHPQLSAGGSALELTWFETRLANTPGQITQIYADSFNGTRFTRQLTGDAMSDGIDQTLVSATSLAIATDGSGHSFVAWGDVSSGQPQIYLRGNTLNIQHIYYVNDGYTSTDAFTTAAGSPANTGLSASSPLDSVQSVFAHYTVGAGDVILVDSGSYSGFAVPYGNGGFTIVGAGGAATHFTSTVTPDLASGATFEWLSFDAGLTLNNASNIEIRNDQIAGVSVSGGIGARIEQDTITGSGIVLTGGTAAAFIAHNTIPTIALTGNGATGMNIIGNRIGGLVSLAASNQNGVISGNNISAVGTGIQIATPFTGSIDHNYIHSPLNSGTGVIYSASAPLNANSIFSEQLGIVASVNDTINGLGFVGASIPNEIFGNAVGVQLSGLMQNQQIFGNATGVIGSVTAGTLGGTSLSTANVIETNQVGTNFIGTIQYNRIDRNQLSMAVHSGQLIAHNLIYSNTANGVETAGATDVRIVNNTFYSTSGNNVLVDGGSNNVQVLNNILRSNAGYDIYVNTDSRVGFFSDYNDLYTTVSGKIVHWLADFTDILDWQIALGLYDLHSIGSAVVSPTEGDPRLFAAPSDDFRLLPLVNGLRASSPASGSGDPATDIGTPPSEQNLLTNPSFENGVNGWSVNLGGATQSSNPQAFDGAGYFYAGAVAAGFAEQTISLTAAGFTTGAIDGQSLAMEFGGRIRSGVESTPAQGQLVATFLNGSGNPIGSPTTLSASNVNDRWELVSSRLNIPIGTRSIRYHFTSLRQTGSADDSYLDGAFVYVQANTLDPDMGAYGNTPADIAQPKPTRLQVITPDLYVDWELGKPHTIQWASYGNNGSPVNIDLYQNGAFLTSIASSVADSGSYIWIPSNTAGITYGMYGLRVQVSLAGNAPVYDRSTETFTIPENGNSYYVNDNSQVNDVYTTAVGSNRNDGKLPSKPKPILTSLLSIYSLGGADTVYVDTGIYNDFSPIELSGNPAIGKSQGVTITGPTNVADVAQINALGFTSPALFDINNGNFITLSHLAIGGGDYGVWVRNNSSNFTARYVTVMSNTFDGIRLELDSSANASLDHLISFGNGRDGISIGGPSVNLTNSIAHNDGNAGILYSNSGAALITGNQSYLNKYGLLITNSTYGTTATVGAADLSLNLGNIFHDNSAFGVYANSGVSVIGNTIYDTASLGGAGPGQLSLTGATGQNLVAGTTYYYQVTAITPAGESGASIQQAITLQSGNTGVTLSWTAVPGATGYNVYRGTSAAYEALIIAGVSGLNFVDKGTLYVGTQIPGYGTAGLQLYGGATASDNVVYTNYLGIYSNGGAISFNRVFDNSGSGIDATNSTNAIGNVSYSNAVGIEGDSSPTWSNNLVYANLVAGVWLHSGFSANIFNNTIYQPSGDGIRIESSGGNFGFQHVNVRNNIVWTQSGYDLTITPQAEIGFQSDYNDFYVTGSGQVGLWESVSRPTLIAWHSAGLTDYNSISKNPLFVNASGGDGQLGFTNLADHGTDDDFHEQSTAGSFHGGSLAPIVNIANGLPTFSAAVLTSDAASSPAVDRGDPAFSYANEPAPNGGFVNLGAYGNTAQASKSFIPYVLVLRPNGGETVVEGQTAILSWRSEDTNGLATLDLMSKAVDGTLTLVANIATNVPNNGSYSWAVPTSIAPAANYVLRVTRLSPIAIGTSAAAFTISGTVHTFYVNDATFSAGDFTTAAGSDSNSGLDPAHPKASIQAILESYSVGTGDVIEVDQGIYTLSSNIVISAAHSGITIRGFHDSLNSSHVAVINRNSITAGSFVFDIQGATGVTLDQLTIVGGDVGLNAADGAGSTNLTISNSDISGGFDYDISLGTGNSGAIITGNKIHDTANQYAYSNIGLYTNNDQVTITNNSFYNDSRIGIKVSQGNNSTIIGNTAYNCGTGIYADTSTISGNIAYNINIGIVVSGASLVTGNTTYYIAGGSQYGPGIGIQAYGGTIQGNVSYGNLYGIYMNAVGVVSNNLVYNNSTDGIYAGGTNIYSVNSVSQNVSYGNGVGIEGDTSPIYQNNLIYNNITAGIWLHNGVAAQILNNTIYQPTGDGVRIESTNGNFSFQHVKLENNIVWTQAGYDLTVTPNSVYGLVSDYNDFYTTGTAEVGVWQNIGRNSLSDWQLASLQDGNTLSVDPLFVNTASSDFHEQSLYGSYHGGSLAPVLNTTTGLPTNSIATLTVDSNQSPTIDLGDPTSTYLNEPAPNGGYINLGAFGNTTQASRSPASYVLVTKPNGGENWIDGQSFNITWRTNNPGTGLIDVDLMHMASGGTLTLAANILTGAANNGSYAWTIPNSIAAGSDYVIRVTREGAPSTADISNATFNIAGATHIYYVNDSTVQAGDWTTAPGNDLNSGLDPAHPKASITGILSAYTLGSADTIRVDAGTYALNGDIVLTAIDSGITIQGYNNASYPTRQAVLNRGNLVSGADFTFDGASNVTIDHLGLTGAYYGIQSTYQVASNSNTISNCEIFSNGEYAIYLIGGADNVTITGCKIHDNDGGIYAYYLTNATVTNNTVYNLRLSGISVSSNGGIISGNNVYNISNNGAIGASSPNSSPAGLITVSNNVVHDNATTGISTQSNVLTIGNTVYNQTGNSVIGIQIGGGEARGNIVYNNYDGLFVSSGLADLNRIYSNANYGIYASNGATVSQNQVYSNLIGIQGNSGPIIKNNLVYSNSSRGILIESGVSTQIVGNTIYQPLGDAIELNSGQQILVSNNILWTLSGYDLTLSGNPSLGFQSDYNDLYITGTGKVARVATQDYPTISDWQYEYAYDTHGISADPQFVNINGADGLLGYTAGADHGVDDNFHLQPTSPAIDAGDPAAAYFLEPAPNGGRVNLGNFGNTAQADPSPTPQSVQITSPGSAQKFQAGQPYTLSWQTAGVTTRQPALFIDAGGPAVGIWAANAYTTVSTFSRTVTNTIDTSGVTNPAPQQVYQSYIAGSGNPGNELAYQIPLPDGNYSLRLHFMEDVSAIGHSVFDIKVNGVVLRSAYDLFADAGAGFKATALSFNVAASGGNGMLIELVSVSGYPTLSGIELNTANASPVPSPTANLQMSTDLGGTWTTIATNQPIDTYGRGTYQWTPAVTTTGPTALFRVLVNGTSLSATSQPFAVYNNGTDYYVNDSSQAGDVFTTAIGNNANSGKSPGSPLADIQAVLSEYNPGAGSIIHVDAGTYMLVQTLTLTAANSGLEIVGPNGATAIINRANGNDAVFTFAGASNIVLDHLSITGGSIGIYANYGFGALHNIVSNDQIFSNTQDGILLGSGNNGWIITTNSIHDNTGSYYTAKGIDIESSQVTITNNKVFNEPQNGIYVADGQQTQGLVTGNETYGDGIGIQGSGTTVTNNLVHDNVTYGIYVSSNSMVTGNTVYRQLANAADGIVVQNSEARSNIVYDNYNGIVGNYTTSTIDRNTVYSNTNFGIYLLNAAGSLVENLVYANSAAGIVLSSTLGELISDNTVYQLVGDAVRLTSSTGAIVRGNILWVEAGDDLNVSVDSQSGFVSDYNDLYHGVGASANVGYWNGATQAQFSNWQSASSQDPNSISADPHFVNAKGADQVLGYNSVGVGYNGGLDDNFFLSSGSPAIDRGYSWAGYSTDILNQPRVDDPGTANTGSAYYVPTDTGSSQYALTGTAQGWRSSYGSFNYSFPAGFSFPFYGTNYASASVSVNGFLQFAGPDQPYGSANSDAALLPDTRIAGFWSALRTDFPGNDIYVDTTALPSQIKFTWKASDYTGTLPVNFSIILFSNGQIRFDYGAGNSNQTPTIGISKGDGQNATFLGYDNSSSLNNARSILISSSPGYNDLGAFEFQGNSSNTVPVTVTSVTPGGIQTGSSGQFNQILLTLSEGVNPIDANALAEYELRGAGPDGVFGTADDVVYTLTPTYINNSNQITLNVGGGIPSAGQYRLTVFSTAAASLHDINGLALDGDANGTPGGSYVRTFQILAPTPLNLTGPAFYLKMDPDGQHVDIWTNTTGAGGYNQQVLRNTLGVVSIQGTSGTDVVVVDFSAGAPLSISGLSDVGGVGSGNVIRIIGSAGNDIITASTGQVVVNGFSINTANVAKTIFTPGAGTDSLSVISGTLTLSPPAAATGITAMMFSAISISAGAKLVMAMPVTSATRSVLITSNLTLAQSGANWTSTLDLAGNDLIVRHGILPTITSSIQSGFNANVGLNWQGTGITSSAAAGDITHLTALGVIQNSTDGTPTGPALFSNGSTFGPFDGINTLNTDVLVKYTYFGDANLDGRVDGSDYTRIDNGYNNHLTGWFNGDFNYDGAVNGSDYTLIDNAFNTQGAKFAAQQSLIGAAGSAEVAVAEVYVGNSTSIAKARENRLIRPTPSSIPATIFQTAARISVRFDADSEIEPLLLKKDVLDKLTSATDSLSESAIS